MVPVSRPAPESSAAVSPSSIVISLTPSGLGSGSTTFNRNSKPSATAAARQHPNVGGVSASPARESLSPGETLRIRWSLLVSGRQPKLGPAWVKTTRTFGGESQQDRVFEETFFWVVTRSLRLLLLHGALRNAPGSRRAWQDRYRPADGHARQRRLVKLFACGASRLCLRTEAYRHTVGCRRCRRSAPGRLFGRDVPLT